MEPFIFISSCYSLRPTAQPQNHEQLTHDIEWFLNIRR